MSNKILTFTLACQLDSEASKAQFDYLHPDNENKPHMFTDIVNVKKIERLPSVTIFFGDDMEKEKYVLIAYWQVNFERYNIILDIKERVIVEYLMTPSGYKAVQSIK